ncbi:hypothetical protein QBC33DRAFT_75062 [Phialemonium atrogriseum]|uniref:Uncharacterized protein n=1 Tax=Phialemonium atrogriseum TaxID=1093897 RepID=A0AAJ0C1J5_9PEZI|nr:uncharacterized protein QBC33DRAFT_75062 [Phialemonium atrogriseum]KAK1767029.1 hypothetical protein QBC33DRAFT_75062 [Phialemonium atrogriseum]
MSCMPFSGWLENPYFPVATLCLCAFSLQVGGEVVGRLETKNFKKKKANVLLLLLLPSSLLSRYTWHFQHHSRKGGKGCVWLWRRFKNEISPQQRFLMVTSFSRSLSHG